MPERPAMPLVRLAGAFLLAAILWVGFYLVSPFAFWLLLALGVSSVVVLVTVALLDSRDLNSAPDDRTLD